MRFVTFWSAGIFWEHYPEVTGGYITKRLFSLALAFSGSSGKAFQHTAACDLEPET
jgi:hypothetical protein